MLALLTLACTWIDDEHAAWRLDPDDDGVPWDQDCDNADPEVGAPPARYVDADGDGFGAGDPQRTCTFEGVDNADDCDDADAAVKPGAEELCDGLDQDCDGVADDGLEPLYDWYLDQDGDGSGAGLSQGAVCAAPPGGALNDGDCDDEDASVSPKGVDLPCDMVDQDCDGLSDDGVHVPGSVSQLQTAIDGAAEFSVICLAEGSFAGPVTIDKSLTVQGAGSGLSVIEGGGPVVTIGKYADFVSLQGLTVQGGEAAYGAGINASATATMLTLSDVVVRDNTCSQENCVGTGIYAQATVVAASLVVQENSATSGKGYSSQGTGIFVAGSFTATDLVVKDNRQTLGGNGYGAGLACSDGAVDVTGATFTGNTQTAADGAPVGGAIYLNYCGARIESAEIAGNDQSAVGKANSSAAGTYGSAIYAYGDSLDLVDVAVGATSHQVEIAGGVAGNSYAPLLLWNGSGTWERVSVVGQNFICEAGGKYAACGLSGGGVGLVGSSVTATDLSVESGFIDFTTYYGSASGGGLRMDSSQLDVRGLRVVGNSVSVPSSSVDNTISGAGIYLWNSEIFGEAVLVADNRASGGEALWGAGIYLGDGLLSLNNAIVANNTLSDSDDGYGGGLYLGDEAGLTNVSVVGNRVDTTKGRGGAFYVSNANLDLLNTIVAFNVASSGAAGYGTSATLQATYGDVYGNSGTTVWSGLDDPSADTAIIELDPMFVDVEGASVDQWDLHLAAGSPAIDAGETRIRDVDDTPSDLGAYGGPGGNW